MAVKQAEGCGPPSRSAIRFQYLRAMAVWAGQGFRWPRGTFEFGARRFRYLRHVYNFTWLNERCVEVPLVRSVVQQRGTQRVLEVGNVLSHYFPECRHEVVDKYERSRSRRVIRADAREYSPAERYDLIVSVSTLEHIGWDERPISREKALETIRHLGDLLAPSGALVFTVPAGYHPALDLALLDGRAGLSRLWALKRSGSDNRWKATDPMDLRGTRFGHPFPFANGIFVGSIGSSTGLE